MLSSGSACKIIPDRARSDSHKCRRLAVVTDETHFALNATRSVIPGNKYVPPPPQIPVGLGFSSNAGAPRFPPFIILGKTLLFGHAAPPSARRETSIVKILAWSRHLFPQPPAQYKQKSRGCHSPSAAATGLFLVLLCVKSFSRPRGNNPPASARHSRPVPDRSAAAATSEWCSRLPRAPAGLYETPDRRSRCADPRPFPSSPDRARSQCRSSTRVLVHRRRS